MCKLFAVSSRYPIKEPGNREFDGVSLVHLLFGNGDNWSDRVLVTDSQRLTNPVKWRKSSTMTQRWRLINGIELYDIQSDPGQRDDVAAQYPDVVASLRKGYEHWWNKVSQHFNGTIPIPVGHNTTEAVLLNAHDWRNNPVLCAWNQALVRQGLECNGYWEVDVLSTSRYTIELRRWPREEDQSISHGISGPLIAYNGIKNGYGGGRALPLVMARLRIGHAEYTQPIKPEDKSIVFPINIDAGETQLQTYLYDETDQDIGAYYVYVEQLSADTDV